jgi:poly-gamma-glutamate synthesis protein (capsule biosynthesis protein)
MRLLAIAAFVLLCSCEQRPRVVTAPAPTEPPVTRLLLGGDVMLSRHVGRLARNGADAALPFRDIAPVFAEADIAFVNLESPFSDRGRRVEKGMVFKAEPETVQGLVLAGIDVASTANNHARDCGAYGVTFTLDWLAKHGIQAVGTAITPDVLRRGVVVERNGARFGFLAYTYDQSNGNHRDIDPRVAVIDVARMREEVGELRSRVDVVVVSMHAGDEYRSKPNPQQVRFARAAIDAGASVVAGHHPHVVQPVERYGAGVIFYSLGNLIFDQFHRRDTQEGLLADVTFKGTKLERYEIHAIDIRRAVPRLRVPLPT